MKHSGQTVLWELWAALCLCTALVRISLLFF